MSFLLSLVPEDFLGLFKKSPFLYFSVTVFLSQVAYQMMNVSLIFLVYYLTASTLAVSILILSFLIPQILFSFLGGIVADVRSKKKILVWGNLLRGILILVLFFNTSSLPLIFMVCILVAVITQFYVPAEPPFIPQIVSKGRLVAANSIFGMSLFGSILVAFVLSGPLIQLLGRSTIFLVISSFFAISGVAAFMLPDEKKRGREMLGSFVGNLVRFFYEDLRASTELLRQKYNVGASFFLLIFSQSIILVLASIIPDYAESILKVPAENLSIVLFAPAAAGMIFSSLLFGGRLGRKDGRAVATIGVFISGFALLFFPLTPYISRIFFHVGTLYVAGVIAFAAGFANAFIFVPSQATIQRTVPEDYRAKVYGLLFGIAGILSLVPILLAGVFADVFGVGVVLSFLGFLILLVAMWRLKLFL